MNGQRDSFGVHRAQTWAAVGSFGLCSNLVLTLVANGWADSWEKGGIESEVAMRIAKYADVRNQCSVEVCPFRSPLGSFG